MLKGRPDQQLRGSALGQSLSRTRWVAFVSHSSHFLRREISLLARQASALVAALIRGRARVLRQAKAHKLTIDLAFALASLLTLFLFLLWMNLLC